jgi:hypothetical protein
MGMDKHKYTTLVVDLTAEPLSSLSPAAIEISGAVVGADTNTPPEQECFSPGTILSGHVSRPWGSFEERNRSWGFPCRKERQTSLASRSTGSNNTSDKRLYRK